MMFKINVDQLQEEPKIIDFECPPKTLELEDAVFHFEGPVTGHLEFKAAGRDVRATGEMDCETWTECARCLRRVDHHLHADVDSTWFWHDPKAVDYEEPEPDEMLADMYEGHEFDASDALREVMMVELPELLYCKDDCKGICPGCGADLNTEPCTCKKKPEDDDPFIPESSWKSAIKKLKNTA